MGYGRYTLASGKEAGYLVRAECEHADCTEVIHRGLAYVCGSTPGDDGDCSCEGYFCNTHLYSVETLDGTHARTELGRYVSLCAQCVSFLAFTDQIDEAALYRADPTFAPEIETRGRLFAWLIELGDKAKGKTDA